MAGKGMRIGLAVLVLFGLLAGLGSTVAGAASFSADMILDEEGTIRQGVLYVQDNRYRMELEEEGRDIAVLVDPAQGITHVVIPDEKTYMEIQNTSSKSLMNNPFEAFRTAAAKYGSHSAGKEALNGMMCRKILVSQEGDELMTAWVAEELQFPVKVVLHVGDGRTLELSNIQEGPQDDALFRPPDRYTQAGGAPAPAAGSDWTAEAATASALSAPHQGMLSEGDVLRVELTPDHALRVHVRNLAPEGSALTSVAFKGSQPIQDPAATTVRLSKEGQARTIEHRETPEQADSIGLHVQTGKVLLDIQPTQDPEGVDLEAFSLDAHQGKELHPDPDKAIRFHLIDDPKDGAEAGGSFSLYTGRAQHKEKIKDIRFRLENKDSRMWAFPASQEIGTLSLMLEEGRVQVRLEQPVEAGVVPPNWKETDADPPPPETEPTEAEKAAKSADAAPETPDPFEAARTQKVSKAFLYILDASGSMWARVEDRPKIAIAKEVMTELIQDLPDASRVGLIAYGHRRKGDCLDVEELVPVSPLNRDALIRILQAISPKGKTPITRSVRLAAEKVKALEDPTTIVLVSDGKETCEGDPCALVRELKQAGLRFVLHVIGFDVTEEERRQLECMAGAGGGTYYTAKTAHAFRSAAKQVMQDPAPPKQGALLVTAFRGGEPFRAMVEVFPSGEHDVLKRGRTGTDPDRPGASLPPGTYDLRVWDENLSSRPEVWIRGVSVEVGRTTEKDAVFDPAGVLELAATKEGEPFDALVRVRPAGSGQNVAHTRLKRGTKAFELDPDTYDILLVDETLPSKPEIRLQGVEVTGGQTTRKEVSFETSGELELTATKAGKPFRAKVMVYPEGSDQRVVHTRLKDGTRAFELAAGTYDVVFVDETVPSKPEIRLQGVQVAGGQATRKEAAFQASAMLELAAFKDGKPFEGKVKVFPSGSDQNVVHTRLKGRPRAFELSAGTYDVLFKDMASEGKPEVWIRGVVLEPGATVKKRAEF